MYFIKKHVSLSTGLTWNGRPWEIAADQLQAINPWTVMVFAPLFGLLFQKLDPNSRRLTAGNKMLAGFLLLFISCSLMSTAGFTAVGTGAKVSILWPVAAYFILTIAEILVYGTGLELAYTAAPKNLKGFVTACFLTTTACGNLVNIWLAGFYEKGLGPGPFFGLSALLVLGAAIAFYFVSREMNRKAVLRESFWESP